MNIGLATTQLTAVVRKEFLEISRATWRSTLAFVAYSVFMQWFIIVQYTSKANTQRLAALPGASAKPLEMAATLSLMFAIPMVITLYASGILVRTFTKERLLGLLLPMLSTGVNPGVLWAGKVCAVFMAGCFVAALCLLLDVLLISQYFKIALAWTAPAVVTIFILAPLASLCIIAVMAFAFWILKSIQFIGAILPTVVSIGLFSFAATHPVVEVLFGGVLAATLIAILVILGLGAIVSRLSRQFLVGF